MGEETKFHDEPYEQDETTFNPDKQSFNESTQWNGLSRVENIEAKPVDGDSNVEANLRNVKHGDKAYNDYE